MSVLEVKEVTSGYGEVQILWGASLVLNEGQMTSLVGANGVGKTTLLRTIVGLIKPWSGSILYRGEDVSRLSAHEKAELGLILVPEGRQLFTDMSVEENLAMGASPRRARAHIDENLKLVFEMFPRLQERRNQRAGTLSGGEQQMLAVARAFMSAQKVMLLDEPSMGLAPKLMLSMFDFLAEISREGTTILLVEQNARLALKFAQRGYVLETGNLVIEGKSEDLLNNPEVKKAYLGG